MTPTDLATLVRVLSLADAYLAKSGHVPCRDDHGQFASCGTGGGKRPRKFGAKGSPEWKKERKRRFHARLTRQFPFLAGKPIGRLVTERTRGAGPNETISDAQFDAITHGRPARTIRRLDSPAHGGRVETTVSTSPYHGILAEESRYDVITRVDGTEEELASANSRAAAFRTADTQHRWMVRELNRDHRPNKAISHKDNPHPCRDDQGQFASCGVGGSARRRNAASLRRHRQNPDLMVSPAARKRRRLRAGRWRQHQRQIGDGVHSPAHAEMLRSHAEDRIGLAGDIKKDRAKTRRILQRDRQKEGRSIRKERERLARTQTAERRQQKKRHERQLETASRGAARDTSGLEARHAAEIGKHGDSPELRARHQGERDRLVARNEQGLRQLEREHREERRDLRAQQANDRIDQRREHRERIEAIRAAQQHEPFDAFERYHEEIRDLRQQHRYTHSQRRLDERDAAREASDAKSHRPWIAKSAHFRVPTSDAILSAALDALGIADAYHAGKLDGRQCLDVLHAVRLEGRRWLREQAERLLESVAPDEAKALFGGVKAKVGAFFDRMRKYLRELFGAGMMALTGPNPAVARDPAAQVSPAGQAQGWLSVPVIQEVLIEQVAEQYDYLATFEAETFAEAVPLTAQFVARAEMYGSAVWNGTLNGQRDVAKKTNIFNFESREHFGVDDRDLCRVCRGEINKGRVPIGTLRVIGDSPCMSQCHCAFNFYETIDGPEYNTIFAGRGPMDFNVFGVTGVGHNW